VPETSAWADESGEEEEGVRRSRGEGEEVGLCGVKTKLVRGGGGARGEAFAGSSVPRRKKAAPVPRNSAPHNGERQGHHSRRRWSREGFEGGCAQAAGRTHTAETDITIHRNRRTTERGALLELEVSETGVTRYSIRRPTERVALLELKIYLHNSEDLALLRATLPVSIAFTRRFFNDKISYFGWAVIWRRATRPWV